MKDLTAERRTRALNCLEDIIEISDMQRDTLAEAELVTDEDRAELIADIQNSIEILKIAVASLEG